MDIQDIIEIARQAEQDDLDRMEGREHSFYEDEDRENKRRIIEEIEHIQGEIILGPASDPLSLFVALRHCCDLNGWDFHDLERQSYGLYLDQKRLRADKTRQCVDVTRL